MKIQYKILITSLVWSVAIGIMLLEHFDLLFWVKGESKGVLEAMNFPFAWMITTRVWEIKITLISTKKGV